MKAALCLMLLLASCGRRPAAPPPEPDAASSRFHELRRGVEHQLEKEHERTLGPIVE
jgi:hypothetical protein